MRVRVKHFDRIIVVAAADDNSRNFHVMADDARFGPVAAQGDGWHIVDMDDYTDEQFDADMLTCRAEVERLRHMESARA